MTVASYNQFCPVAMAAEVICSRWTLLLLRELHAGSTRFNELRRGVPRMSPALLSKRLKELEAAGVVARADRDEAAQSEYRLTAAGEDLKPIIEAVGVWGHRWIETETSLKNLDVDLLMWDIRRNIDPSPMPRRRCTIEVIYPDLPEAKRCWWLVVTPSGEVDLCSLDPGYEVDLYLSTSVRTMTEVWMGYTTVQRAEAEGGLSLTGSKELKTRLNDWLRLSPFAKVEKLVA